MNPTFHKILLTLGAVAAGYVILLVVAFLAGLIGGLIYDPATVKTYASSPTARTLGLIVWLGTSAFFIWKIWSKRDNQTHRHITA